MLVFFYVGSACVLGCGERGVPLLYGLLLHFARESLTHHKQPTELSRRLGFLADGYAKGTPTRHRC